MYNILFNVRPYNENMTPGVGRRMSMENGVTEYTGCPKKTTTILK
jgi:hypothetical protein